MKKVVFILALSFAIPGLALAQSSPEINSGIEAIIEGLQSIVASLPSDTEIFCYDFSSNMRVGSFGEEVKALHSALGKQDFNIDQEEIDVNKFGDSTASAVTGFQQKYPEEILTPVGLVYGTGAVGPYTREKLNNLYGCEGRYLALESTPQVLGVSVSAEQEKDGALAMIIEIMSQILEKLGDILGR